MKVGGWMKTKYQISIGIGGLLAMCAVGPATTLEGIILAGIPACALIYYGTKDVDNDAVEIEVFEPTVHVGHTHMTVGSYPKVNPYTRRI